MKIDYAHKLSNDEAYNRITNLLQELQKQYADKISNPRTSWNKNHTQMDFSIKVMGFNTEGQVYLRQGQVTLEGKIPFMARPFSGKIERMIKEKLEDLLS